MSYVLTVRLTIKAESLAEYMPRCLENARISRETEPGCRQFDVLVDPDDATQLMFYEVYDDEAAFQAHQSSERFKQYLAQTLPLLATRQRSFWQRAAP